MGLPAFVRKGTVADCSKEELLVGCVQDWFDWILGYQGMGNRGIGHFPDTSVAVDNLGS